MHIKITFVCHVNNHISIVALNNGLNEIIVFD